MAGARGRDFVSRFGIGNAVVRGGNELMAYPLGLCATLLPRLLRGLAIAGIVGALGAPAALAQNRPDPAGLLVHFETTADGPAIDARFRDADDREVALSEFRGRVVVLNFWATWCAPCLKEMPSLDRAQAALGSQVKVIALSLDAASSRPKVAPFYRAQNISQLGIHFDIGRKAFQAFNVVVLPTTILIGPDGREIGRLQGEAEWDAPDMLALIRRAIPATQ